jgi:hypothetical protein
MTDTEDKPEKNPVFRTFEEARKAGATGLIDIDPTLPEQPLPCPFCGGEATFRDFVEESIQTSKDYHKTKLCCENDRCEIQPETVDMVIREDSNEDIHGQLIKDWNTRA